ncbi:MAG: CPBP family intramembrane glutamic endopeptidase [Ilumatobacteraceae bacterium]
MRVGDVTRTRTARRDVGRPIDLPVAVLTWVGAFVVGQLASTIIVGLSGVEDVDAVPIPTLFIALAATWTAYLAGLWWASRRAGTGDPVADYRVRFRPIDAIGAPIGIVTQLVVVPLVYLPLSRIWPSTFSEDELAENAERLVDRASGATTVLLFVIVCIGAPIVEELVYRGMLQRAFAARFHQVVAWVVVAAWFAIIHFRPVEYPGLFAFGLVAGACVLFTGRLGMAIVTHIAFNVTGLVLAVR